MWRAARYFKFPVSGVSRSSAFVRCESNAAAEAIKPKTEIKPEAKAKDTPPPPPPPPPPPSQKSGGGAFWKLTGLTLLGAGGVVGYAWYDPKFRKSLEKNLPYSKEGLDYIFSYFDSGKTQECPKPKDTAIAQPTEKGLAKVIQVDVPQDKPKEVIKDEVKLTAQKKDEQRNEAAEKKRIEKQAAEDKKQRDKLEAERRLKAKEVEEAAENAALETILEDLRRRASDSVECAVSSLRIAAGATRLHTKTLKQAIEESDVAGKEAQWAEVNRAFDGKTKAQAAAEKKSEDARLLIEKMKSVVKSGRDNKITRRNKDLCASDTMLYKLSHDLLEAEADNNKSQSEAKLMSEYKDLVRRGKDQFKKELESIKPDVKLGKRFGGKLNEEELNSLIAHAHRRIEQLQKQLAEQMALEAQRIDEAMEKQKEMDEKFADSRVDLERIRLEGDFCAEKDKWDTEARVAFEAELRQELTRQAAAHSDHLAEVLKVQENELDQKYQSLLGDRIIEEREQFRTDVAGWIARLRGIETAIEARADMEKQGRDAQELWIACQALQTAIKTGEPEGNSEEEQLKPLNEELLAIRKAGSDHPFVSAILCSIPEDAIQRGVWTEENLKRRFRKVKRMCRRVAMIDETGGTLFKYFLAFLQSALVVTRRKPIAEDAELDICELDTYMLLDNAGYCLEKGDLEQAVKYMNQLRGEARVVAADWLSETRLLLEARQASNALLAHATANGLGSLF